MFEIMSAAAWSRRGRVIACAALLSSGLVGCGGGAQVRTGVVHNHPVYYVDEPPPRIQSYPQTRYHDRPAYLVQERWYYSTPRGWAYFREEPRELRAYRERRQVRRAEPTPQRRYRADEPERRSYRVPREAQPEEPTEGQRRRYEAD